MVRRGEHQRAPHAGWQLPEGVRARAGRRRVERGVQGAEGAPSRGEKGM